MTLRAQDLLDWMSVKWEVGIVNLLFFIILFSSGLLIAGMYCRMNVGIMLQ
jgi:hypothetical protein